MTLVVTRTGIRRVPVVVRMGTDRVVVRVVVRRTVNYFARRLGAAWESADPAAVLEADEVRPSRRSLEAALGSTGR